MKRLQWRVLIVAALSIGIVCWVIGARVGAGLIREQLQELLARTTTQVLTLDHLSFNPFTLTATFTGLQVDDADIGPVLTAAAGRLRLTVNGLFDNTIAVSDFFLDQPRLVVAVSGPPGNRQLHSLGGLLAANSNARKRPPVHIVHAQISHGHVTVYNFSGPGTPLASMGINIDDVNLELTDLISDATTAATFDLTARINETGTLGIQGHWVPSSHAVEAAVQLNDLALAPMGTVLDPWFADLQLAGVLAMHGRFRHHSDNPGFNGELVIEELTVDDSNGQSLLSVSRLTAHGLTIGDAQPTVVDIQWLELHRPRVALLFDEDGQFNLRRLMSGAVARIDKVTTRDGDISFTDARLPATVRIDAHNIMGELTRHVEGPRQTLNISLTGALADEGTATLDGVFHVSDGQVQGEGDATLRGVDARIVSAYVGHWIAREITAGLLDLSLRYGIDKTGLELDNTIVLADLELRAPTGDVPTAGLPVDLTVALLTDENGRMVFELPVNVAPFGSGKEIRLEFGDALTNFITATTANPMDTVARLSGLEADEVSRIEFAAGSTEISPTTEHQLAAVANALTRRPLLGARAQGHYSGRTDRKALARRQVGLHIALAASTRAGESSETSELDFTDPKVQAVLDEFAAARLDATERNALNAGYPTNGDETATVANPAYYPTVFEALTAKETVSDYALRQLARYRAHSLVGRLQELGVDTQRLAVDKNATPVAPDDAPGAVALTVVAYRQSGE